MGKFTKARFSCKERQQVCNGKFGADLPRSLEKETSAKSSVETDHMWMVAVWVGFSRSTSYFPVSGGFGIRYFGPIHICVSLSLIDAGGVLLP